jgi:hypothetical protein
MSAFRDMVDELKAKVRAKHGPYASWHEAHSVLREEFEEFWDEVKKKEAERDPERLLSELVDIVQVSERAAEDFGLVPAEPPNKDERESYYAEKYLHLSIAVQNFLTLSQQVKLNIQQVKPVKDTDQGIKVKGNFVSLLVPVDELENLESLVENDRILPA